MHQGRSYSKRMPGGDRYRSWRGQSVPIWGQESVWQAGRREYRPYQVTFASASAGSEVESPGSQIDPDSGIHDDPVTKRKRVEAVLLLSKSPINTRKIAQLAHLADGTEARTLVRDLNQTYDRLGRAMRIELVAGGYRMLTRPAIAPWIAKLGYLPPITRLSSPMLETLSVVAYRQTVSRADIEAVRGVACGELLRQLMERDLVRIAGRSEELGRPYLYGTTKRFLQLFGLPSVNALPPIRWQMLQDDPSQQNSTPDDFDSNIDELPISTKEPVVITSVAPVLTEAGIALSSADHEIHPMANAVESDLSLDVQDDSDIDAMNVAAPIEDEPSLQTPDADAIIEDEEDDLYGDSDDDEEDDWDDDDLDDDDLDDDDDDLDDDDEDDDELGEDEEWEEVDDDDEDDDDEVDDEEIEEEWDDDDEEDDDWDDDDEDDSEEEEEEAWD